jgi:23S rRNA (cytidine2498-2'-O)-methyltransferase
LVQLALLDNNLGIYSCHLSSPSDPHRHSREGGNPAFASGDSALDSRLRGNDGTGDPWESVLAAAPQGIVEIPDDRQAPSRAFKKLLEAEVILGARIEAGHTCVDLGACPGGWTYIALARGATVQALDRTLLRDDLMRNPALHFTRQDAFTFLPEQPVDWLLSDVIAYPDRILELLKRWIDAKRCRQFVVTIKFKGADDYPKLALITEFLRSNTAWFRLRRLYHNKNEVTAMGRVS